jgi:hypothetical protein
LFGFQAYVLVGFVSFQTLRPPVPFVGSIFAGFVVFAFIGHLADETGVEVANVATGQSLVKGRPKRE